MIYETEECSQQPLVLSPMRCFSESLESFKKWLNFTPLIKEAVVVFSRFQTLWEKSECSNLEHLGGNLEHMGGCVFQIKSLEVPFGTCWPKLQTHCPKTPYLGSKSLQTSLEVDAIKSATWKHKVEKAQHYPQNITFHGLLNILLKDPAVCL